MSWDAGDGHHVLPYDDRGVDLFWSEQASLGAVALCVCGWRGSRRPWQDPEDDRTREDCQREWAHHLRFWNAEDM